MAPVNIMFVRVTYYYVQYNIVQALLHYENSTFRNANRVFSTSFCFSKHLLYYYTVYYCNDRRN